MVRASTSVVGSLNDGVDGRIVVQQQREDVRSDHKPSAGRPKKADQNAHVAEPVLRAEFFIPTSVLLRLPRWSALLLQ